MTRHDADFIVNVDGITMYGKRRPGLKEFLTYAFRHFETVSVWTAATRPYAVQVLHHIMTPEQRRRLFFFWTREDLEMKYDGSFYKPLDKMFAHPNAFRYGMNRGNTLMVDDRWDVMAKNPGNGIVIPAYKGKEKDTWLYKLIIIIDSMRKLGISPASMTKLTYLKKLTGGTSTRRSRRRH
jgi:TFIIF-interacting CTD phosphatase-like protein